MTPTGAAAPEDRRTPAAAGLLLRCRGYPELSHGGRVLPLKLKRGLALLVHLSELARKVARNALAELLWPDAPVELGRARLRRLCHQVNAVIGQDLVVGDYDALWLSGAHGPLCSDVIEVRRRATQWVVSTPPASGAGAFASELELLCEDRAHCVLDGFEIGSDACWIFPSGHRAWPAR